MYVFLIVINCVFNIDINKMSSSDREKYRSHPSGYKK